MKDISPNQQVINWLTTVMEQPQNARISEFFYYDKKDNEFFSILSIDYFLFDDDWSIPEDTSSSYTNEEILVLADRMKRIQNDDTSIVFIPPGGLQKSEDVENAINALLLQHSIDLQSSTVCEVENNGESSVTVDLTSDTDDESTQNTKRRWWKFW